MYNLSQFQVKPDQEDPRVSQVSLDPLAVLDLLDSLDLKVELDLLDHLDLLEPLVSLVREVTGVTEDHKVHREQLAKQVCIIT